MRLFPQHVLSGFGENISLFSGSFSSVRIPTSFQMEGAYSLLLPALQTDTSLSLVIEWVTAKECILFLALKKGVSISP